MPANCAHCGSTIPTANRWLPPVGNYTDEGLICASCSPQIQGESEEVTDPFVDADTQVVDAEKAGSYPLGFLAGFFGVLIGYILVRCFAKGEKTKRGALVGFCTSAILPVLIPGFRRSLLAALLEFMEALGSIF